jgi:hypothetical protein
LLAHYERFGTELVLNRDLLTDGASWVKGKWGFSIFQTGNATEAPLLVPAPIFQR